MYTFSTLAKKANRVPYVEKEVDKIEVVPVSVVDAQRMRDTPDMEEFFIADASTVHRHESVNDFYKLRDELRGEGFDYVRDSRLPGINLGVTADEFVLPMEMLIGFTFVNLDEATTAGLRLPQKGELSVIWGTENANTHAYAFLSDIVLREIDGDKSWVMI